MVTCAPPASTWNASTRQPLIDLERGHVEVLGGEDSTQRSQIEFPRRRTTRYRSARHHRAADDNAALAPGEAGRPEIETLPLARVAHVEAARADVDRAALEPRREEPAGLQLEGEIAPQDLAGRGQLDGALPRDRKVDAVEDGELGQPARQSLRHQVMHGRIDANGLRLLRILGTEGEGPGAARGRDLARPDDDAALLLVLQIDVELEHAPHGALARGVQNDLGILETDCLQERCRVHLPAGARRGLRKRPGQREASHARLRR
jgi:hypothetical protein